MNTPDTPSTELGSTESGSAEVNLPGIDLSVDETDKTVISSGSPQSLDSALDSIPTGLHPRELGRLLVGQHLDDLFLEEYVGGGGMGAVFRANDTKLNRRVAVKVLSTFYANDEGVAKRFQIEAQSAARLDHPNIARVHSVGEDRSVPYIVFEYIDGINLRDLVLQRGPLPLADAIEYTLQIADALAHAWQRSVVHRDIKPSNILVTESQHAKLVDMGLARLHQVDQDEADLTTTGMTIGTFDYISPEQARNPKDADTRSDIYSLGCTLFFILTGKPPFSGGTALQKLLQHQGEQPPTLEQFRDDVPEAVSQLLSTMLAKQPSDRFQNPAELLDALISVADGLGISHSAIAIPPYLLPNDNQRSLLLRHAPWAVPLLLLATSIIGYESLASGNRERAGFESEQLAIPASQLETSTPPEIDTSENSGSEANDSSVNRSFLDSNSLKTTSVERGQEPLRAAPIPPTFGPEETTPPFPITPDGSLPVLSEPQIQTGG